MSVARCRLGIVISALLFVFLFPVTVAGPRGGLASASLQFADYASMIDSVDIDRVEEHVNFLSETMYIENDILPTRATGTLGNELAAQYVRDRFEEYGLEPLDTLGGFFFEFKVAVPLGRGANVTLQNGGLIPLYPMMPNMVCPSTTPPEGVTGALVYASDGYLPDFDGKKVIDGIVILDWDTENRWLNAVKLGAEAVIFLPPKDLEKTMSPYGNRWNTKYLPEVPLNFPRFYVERDDADNLLRHLGEEVTVKSTVIWEEVTGKNVVGIVPGTTNPDVYFGVTSYYDSYSIAPDIAPGAQEATGVAALLELAKYFSEHPAKASLLFIAYGGHHQELAGSFAWTNEYHAWWVEEPEKTAIGENTWYLFNLDLSTGTDASYVTMISPSYGPGWNRFSAAFRQSGFYLTGVIDAINAERARLGLRTHDVRMDEQMGAKGPGTGIEWDLALPMKNFPYDHEVPVSLETPGAHSITTAYDVRPYFRTPFDTFDRVNFDDLETQLELAHALILHVYLEEDPDYLIGTDGPFGDFSAIDRKNQCVIFAHYCVEEGQVAVWSPQKAWYDFVPRALVHAYFSHSMHEGEYVQPEGLLYFSRRNVFADDEGYFAFKGGYSCDLGGIHLTGWVIDPTTGDPIMAPDFGEHQYYRFPTRGWTRTDLTPVEKVGFVTVNNFSSVVLLDSILPESLFVVGPTGMLEPPLVVVNDFESHVSPEHWGTLQEPSLTISVLFVRPDTPVEIMLTRPGERYPAAILANTSQENPVGVGYVFKPGQTIITFPVLQYAENLQWIIKERFDVLGKFRRTSVPTLERYQSAVEKIEKAHEALSPPRYEYSTAYTYAIEAWSELRKLYVEQRTEIEASTAVAPSLAIFLVPFTYLAEKLLFNRTGTKRILSLVGTFAVVMFALYFVHPAFQVCGDPVMIIIGITTLILLFPTIFIVFGKFTALIEALRIRFMGRHEARISRSEEVMNSFSVGIENMRRRKFRSALVLVSIAIMVSSLVALTSISPIFSYTTEPWIQGSPAYQGVLARRDHWGSGEDGYWLGEIVTEHVAASLADSSFVALRAWARVLYPNFQTQGESGFHVTHEGKIIYPQAMLGLTAQEDEVSLLDGFLTAGRWFEPDDRHACILNTVQAEKLGVTGPTAVRIHGLPFNVVGIVDYDSIRFFLDLDGEPITPINLDILPQEQQWEIHMDPEKVLIVTYWSAKNIYGGHTASIAIGGLDENLVPTVARDFFDVLSTLNYYTCPDVARGEVGVTSRRTFVQVMGLESQLVPLGIVLFSVLNIVLGGVYERKREISTYSSVGLSPLSIALMFISETVIYAVIAGVTGFITGSVFQSAASAILGTPSSYTTAPFFFGVALSMLIAVSASTYPAYIAARLVTPSLERAWRIATKAVGDEWEVPLPFFSSGEEETNGILAFMYEFLQAHMGADAPIFSCSNIRLEEGTIEELRYKGLRLSARLFPYELGISQETLIAALESSPTRWTFSVSSERKMGIREEWVKAYRNFVDQIRKQLLLWRSMNSEDREEYYVMFKELSS